jgi:hypothetical protein
MKSEVFWENTVSVGEQLQTFRRVLLPPSSGLQDECGSSIFRNVCNHWQNDSHHVQDEFSIHSFKTPHR